MSVACIIDYEDVPFRPHMPYVFATLPRVGEIVALHGDEKRPVHRFKVVNVVHVPDGVEDGKLAFTVLKVLQLWGG